MPSVFELHEYNQIETIYLFHWNENMKTVRPFDLRIRSEVTALLKFEGQRCKDNRIISLLKICNAQQTAKQMKDLRLKYEITLGRLKYSQRNATYNSVG